MHTYLIAMGYNKGIWDDSSLSGASNVKAISVVQLPVRTSPWDPPSMRGREKQREMAGSVCVAAPAFKGVELRQWSRFLASTPCKATPSALIDPLRMR